MVQFSHVPSFQKFQQVWGWEVFHLKEEGHGTSFKPSYVKIGPVAKNIICDALLQQMLVCGHK